MRKNSIQGVFRYNLGATVDPRIVQELDRKRGQANDDQNKED